MRVEAPNDFMSSRTRFRGEIQKAFGKSSMFASFNLNQNSILKELNGFELREAYFDYSAEHWSFRAGRQLIIWGTADGMRITDRISPLDMTEFLARDYDDIRMPVEALKFSYFRSIFKLELVYIPISKNFILPTNPRNPWAMPIPTVEGVEIELLPDENPEFKIENSEFGGRFSVNLSGLDFSVSALHTFNKMPIITKNIVFPKIVLKPEHHRMTFVGADFSKPIWQFVIRGEFAFDIDRSFATKDIPTVLEKHNSINALLGLDWYASSDWMFSTQFSNNTILNYNDNLEEKENSMLFTFSVSKSILNNNLKLSDFIYFDLNNSGFFNRFSVDYALTDQIRFLVGYDHFEGDEGMFSYFNKNSEVWIKAKYSF